MDKINTTKDMRGKAKARLTWKKEWNEGFYHVRLTYDWSNNKRPR